MRFAADQTDNMLPFDTSTMKVDGRAHVRVADTEWLDAEADIADELRGSGPLQGTREHVILKLTPRGDIRLAPALAAMLD